MLLNCLLLKKTSMVLLCLTLPIYKFMAKQTDRLFPYPNYQRADPGVDVSNMSTVGLKPW